MRVQGCDAVQVAVLLSEVQAVTNNELGLDVPADVLDLNVSLDDLGLAQQGANLNGSCAARNAQRRRTWCRNRKKKQPSSPWCSGP